MPEIGEDHGGGLSHIGNMAIDDNKELRQSQAFLTSIPMGHSPIEKEITKHGKA